jgi:hypothetical protein
MRRIRAALPALCDTILTSAATPQEQLRKAVQAAGPMVKDVQRRLSCQELKYPRRRLSTPTFAAGLKFRLKAMALAGPFFVQRNDTES